MKNKLALFLLLACFCLQSGTCSQTNNLRLDVPFVETPDKVVQIMLDMAQVNNQDTLYDLGCGDGRIVISAAKQFGTFGVGIDINPLRIEECRANAKKATVEDKVQFYQKDLFEADFSRATVLTLYLLERINFRLRPKILNELAPGTRVVSHDFSMRDWKPDSTEIIPMDFDTHTVYMWYVPSDVQGQWAVEISSTDDENNLIFYIDQKFQKINGKAIFNGSHLELLNPKLVGDKISFKIFLPHNTDSMTFKGRVTLAGMEGIVQHYSGSQYTNRQWNAYKQ